MKYNPLILKKCVEWIEEHGLEDMGGSSKNDLFKAAGIDANTFSRWMMREDFALAIAKAKIVYLSNLENRLVRTLIGQSSESVDATIFLLQHIDPVKWKKRTTNEMIGVDGETIASLVQILLADSSAKVEIEKK